MICMKTNTVGYKSKNKNGSRLKNNNNQTKKRMIEELEHK